MYYGFDVGGTKIQFAAFDQDLQQVASERVSTPIVDYSQLLQVISHLVFKYDQIFSSQGHVGIGLPGIENALSGKVMTANIPSAQDQTLRQDLEKMMQRNVAIENDANCFALSEAYDEKLQSVSSVLGLILGTGVGSGIVINGQIYSGLNHCAGEIGHMRLPLDAWWLLEQCCDPAPMFDCGCGQKGCIDNYLSGRGFENLYRYMHKEAYCAVDIIAAYTAGKPQAKAFVDIYMELLAICLANIINALDPAVVVLGGGLSNFDLIYTEVPKRMVHYQLPMALVTPILKAQHGDAGGVRGAAFLNVK